MLERMALFCLLWMSAHVLFFGASVTTVCLFSLLLGEY